ALAGRAFLAFLSGVLAFGGLAVALGLAGVLLAFTAALGALLRIVLAVRLGLAVLGLVALVVLALADQVLRLVLDLALVLGDVLGIAPALLNLGAETFLLANDVLELLKHLLGLEPLGLEELGAVVLHQHRDQLLQVLVQVRID